jgi:hypothetical protein
MKAIIILWFLIAITSCSENKKPSEKEEKKELSSMTSKACDENYDSLLLKYSDEFKAENVMLNKSLSPELSSFVLRIDTTCLRRQKEYRVFITTILAKLYYYHLICCNQGYDLRSMKEGASNVIINEFEVLGNYKEKGLEMLNSGNIIDFISTEESLKNNIPIQELVRKIKLESARIEKGDI